MLEDNLNESLHCEDFKDWTYSIDDVDGSAVIRHHNIKLTQDPEKNTDKWLYGQNIFGVKMNRLIFIPKFDTKNHFVT